MKQTGSSHVSVNGPDQSSGPDDVFVATAMSGRVTGIAEICSFVICRQITIIGQQNCVNCANSIAYNNTQIQRRKYRAYTL